MKKIILMLSLTTLFLANAVQAKDDAVDRLFKAMNMQEQFNSGFEAMLPMIDQMAIQYKLDAKGKEELKNIYREWFDKDIDRNLVMSKMRKIYADAFSDDEIEKIIKFYQTSTGQKLLKETPRLMQLGAQIGMQEAQSKQQQLKDRLDPFFKKQSTK